MFKKKQKYSTRNPPFFGSQATRFSFYSGYCVSVLVVCSWVMLIWEFLYFRNKLVFFMLLYFAWHTHRQTDAQRTLHQLKLVTRLSVTVSITSEFCVCCKIRLCNWQSDRKTGVRFRTLNTDGCAFLRFQFVFRKTRFWCLLQPWQVSLC